MDVLAGTMEFNPLVLETGSSPGCFRHGNTSCAIGLDVGPVQEKSDLLYK